MAIAYKCVQKQKPVCFLMWNHNSCVTWGQNAFNDLFVRMMTRASSLNTFTLALAITGKCSLKPLLLLLDNRNNCTPCTHNIFFLSECMYIAFHGRCLRLFGKNLTINSAIQMHACNKESYAYTKTKRQKYQFQYYSECEKIAEQHRTIHTKHSWVAGITYLFTVVCT